MNLTGNVSGFDVIAANETTSSGLMSAVMTALKVSIGVTGVIGNLLVICIIYKHKKLFQQVKLAYVVNQSCIDGATSAVLILCTVFGVELMDSVASLKAELYCRLWLTQTLLWGLMTSSTYNLVAITIERYFAIVHPFWHRISFTDAKSRASLVAIWSFGVLYVGMLLIPTSAIVDGTCLIARFWPSHEVAVAAGILQLFIYSLVPFLTHTICYARIMTTLHKRCGNRSGATTSISADVWVTPTCVERNPAGEARTSPWRSWPRRKNDIILQARAEISCSFVAPSNSQQDVRRKQRANAKRNVTSTLVAVTACYFICWLPNEIYVTLYVSGLISRLGAVYQATVILMFVNCCVNPVIYVTKYDAFKKGVTLMFGCRSLRGCYGDGPDLQSGNSGCSNLKPSSCTYKL